MDSEEVFWTESWAESADAAAGESGVGMVSAHACTEGDVTYSIGESLLAGLVEKD